MIRGALRIAMGACLLAALVPTGCGSRDSASSGGSSGGSEASDTTAASGGAFGPGHARVRLLADAGSITPGASFTLGVDLEIEPGWHVYWDGVNDTGYPVKVTPRLPEGFTAGALEWPAPERHVSPGDILDHVYRDHVTLLLPVQAPAALPSGDPVHLGVAVAWLACHEACVPGSGEASLTLPAGAPDAPAAPTPEGVAARFAETRARLPEPLTPASGIRWRWDSGAAGGGSVGAVLAVTSDGANRMEFYPYRDSAPLAAILKDGASDSGILTLHLAENPDSAPAVRGVLAVERTGTTAFYVLEARLPGPHTEGNERRTDP